MSGRLRRLRPRGRLWRQADFLKLWGGQTISALGTGITVLALPTVAVLQLHASPFAVGLLIACNRLPFPLLGLVAGGLIDRRRKRPLMVLADCGRLAALALVPLAALEGRLSLPLLYGISLTMGVLTLVFDVAYLAYLPALVGRENLVEGNSKLQFTQILEDVVGGGIGGFLIQLFGGARAVAIDAVSYLFSVLSLLLIERPEAPADRVARRSLWREIGEGLRLVFKQAVLRSQLLSFLVLIVGLHGAQAVELPFFYRWLHLSPGVVGLFYSALGVAGIAGFAATGGVLGRLGVGRAIGFANVVAACFIALMPLSLLVASVPLLLLCFLGAGFFDTISNIAQVSLRQSLTPDRLQARMNATFRTGYWGADPVGSILGGLLGTVIGTPETIVLGAGLGVLGGVALLLSAVGKVREMPSEPAPEFA